MNVRLQYELEFMGGIYFEDALQMNQYSVSLQLLTQTSNTVNIGIAMERLKAFVYSELNSAVFFGPKDADKAELFAMIGTNVVTLPDEPVDQIIGMALYCKLNAIMQEHMIVTDLDIQSYLGDSVWYKHSDDDALGPCAKDGWWHLPTCQHNNIDTASAEDKVVKVATTGWTEYGLDWPEPQPEQFGNTVVFTRIQKNENESAQ
jgi:hypothetical protein